MTEQSTFELGPKSIIFGTAVTIAGLLHLLPLTMAAIAIAAMYLLRKQFLAVLFVFGVTLFTLSMFFKRVFENEK